MPHARTRLEELKNRRAARLSCPRTADRTDDSVNNSAVLPSVSPTQPTPVKRVAPARHPTPLIPVVVDGPQTDTWAILAKRAEEQQNRDRAIARLDHARKMEEQKRVLDEQVELRRRRRAEERARFLSERSIVDNQYTEWVADKCSEVERRREVMAVVGQDRQQQIDLRHIKKEQEVARNVEADNQILANIARREAEAKVRKQEQRRRQEAMREELVKANDLLKERKRREKAADVEWQRAVEEDMRRQEELEYQRRAAELEAFRDKVKGREAMAMKLQTTVEQRAAEDERRAAAVTRQREAKEDEERRIQAELRERLKRATLAVRENQVAARAEASAAAKEAKLREREELDALVELEKQAKMERLRELQEKRLKRKNEAEEQLREKSRYQRVVMSEEEHRLNQRLLSD